MKAQNIIQNTAIQSKWGRVFQVAKRVALSTPSKSALAAVVMISLVCIPLLTKAQDSNEKRTLTGNWMVTVTRINPPPGLAPTFLSLMTFLEDGNVLEESNNTLIRSTGRGNWDRIGHQQFSRSIHFFVFDPARNYVGTRRITAAVTLSEGGSEFQANAVIQSFDPAGNLLTTAQSTEVGQRF